MTQKSYSRRHILRLMGAVAAGIAVSSCSGRGGEPDYTVEIFDERGFSPGGLIVPLGAKVAWKNQGAAVHTVTANPVLAQQARNVWLPEDAEPWDSGDLFPGEIFTYIFSTAGQYVYFCRYQETEGFIGNIHVTDGNS